MASRVDRLAAHLRSSPDAEGLLAGRVGGGLWLIAALATFALPFFPQVDTPLWPWPALWTAGALIWGVCAIFAIDWRVAPAWVLPTANAAAIVVITAITQITGGVTSPSRLYIFFALVYASCFIATRWAVCLIVACAVGWSLPVVTDRGIAPALGALTMALPIFAIVGGLLLLGRALLARMYVDARRLSEEHHALRSIATAVAAGQATEVICSRAAEQAALLLSADGGGVLRYDADEQVTAVGTWQRGGRHVPPGSRFPLAPTSPLTTIRDENRPVRIDDTRKLGHYSATLRESGFVALAGTPIHVRGRLWGAAIVTARDGRAFPDDTEQHLSEFAELIGMAVANTEEVARLAADATTDPLTGLANHRAFQERLRGELARAQRHGTSVALALVDVDNFKVVNDTGGHAAGDAVLRAVAASLKEHLRVEDVLARVGGDEFAILLPAATAADAAEGLERARRAIERAAHAPVGVRVTVSVGVCDVAHAADAELLTRFADGALYWSKEHGRNRVSVYDPATIHELSAVERIGALQRSQALAGIRALARAIDARDPSTSEHSERVAKIAARLAEARGWSAERVALLHEAALVHDVGKIGIPDAILLKPAPLSRDEHETIKTHAVIGARMVEDLLSAEQVEWILAHHERPDGSGYPRALARDDLTEGGGLLAAADAFDVMVSARPYSPARTPADALAEARSLVDRQFTPAAVAALEAVYGASMITA